MPSPGLTFLLPLAGVIVNCACGEGAGFDLGPAPSTAVPPEQAATRSSAAATITAAASAVSVVWVSLHDRVTAAQGRRRGEREQPCPGMGDLVVRAREHGTQAAPGPAGQLLDLLCPPL